MNHVSLRLLLVGCTVAVAAHGADAAANPPAKRTPVKRDPVKLTAAPTRHESRVYLVTPVGELKLHFFRPTAGKASDRRPAIVFFHGSGDGAEQFFPQAEYFASRGLVGASADYTVYRKNGGPGSGVDDSVGQAKAAVRWLRSHASELGIDPNKVIAAGGSLGGMLALTTALVPGFDARGDDRTIACEPNALVLFNPAINLGPNLPNAAGEMIGDQVAPALFQKQGAPPAIIFFGTADRHNEPASAFVAKSRTLGNRCDYFTAAGQTHGFFNGQPWTAATVIQADKFLASLGYLQGAPTLQPADPAAVLVEVK